MANVQPLLSKSLSLFWGVNALLFFLHYPTKGAPEIPQILSWGAGVVSLLFCLGNLFSFRWVKWAQVLWLMTEPIFLSLQNPYFLVHPLGLSSKNIPIILLLLSNQQKKRIHFAVALVWLTEGLFPKILFQQAMELSMAIWFFQGWIKPSIALYLIGIAQILSGALSLFAPPKIAKLVLWAQVAGLVVLPILVILYDASFALFLFAPLFKNLPILASTYWLARERP